MRRYLLVPAALVIVFSLVIVFGRRGNPFSDLNAPEQFLLLSIDGRDEDRRLKDVAVQPTETFRGYPVLGKVGVTDPELRKQLIAALKDGFARRPKNGLACFWPRHGIRVVEKGRTVEYVICFECWQFSEFAEGKHRHELINPDVQPAFDKPLRDAGAPIAPE